MPKEIQLHSDFFNEVFGSNPPWIVKNGIGLVAIFFLLLILLCAFVKIHQFHDAQLYLSTKGSNVVGVINTSDSELDMLECGQETTIYFKTVGKKEYEEWNARVDSITVASDVRKDAVFYLTFQFGSRVDVNELKQYDGKKYPVEVSVGDLRLVELIFAPIIHTCSLKVPNSNDRLKK